MSTHEPAATAPPKLIVCVAIVAAAIVIAFVFGRAFDQAPARTNAQGHNHGHSDAVPHQSDRDKASHEHHATDTGPIYNAGGIWSADLGLRGLADLLFLAKAGERSLACHSLTWSDGQLVVIDATPPTLAPGEPDEPLGLAVVAVDHVGGDIDPDFANAIRDHLLSLADSERLIFLTPLPGPDKRPAREDPYDWSFLASDETISGKIDLYDLSDTEPQADLPGKPQSGMLLAVAEEALDRPDLESVQAYLQQLEQPEPASSAAAFELSLMSPYAVMPRLTAWLGNGADAERLNDALALARAMHIGADAWIEQAAASEADTLRAQAARALGDLAEFVSDPIPHLTRLAEDQESMDVRYEALVSTRAIPGRVAAGVAELVEPYEMTDAMRLVYRATMDELLAFGEPVPADSRANRLRRMTITQLLAEARDPLVCAILLERTDLPDDKIGEVLGQLAEANGTVPLISLTNLLESMTPRTLAKRTVLLETLVDWEADELDAQTPRLTELALGSGPDKLRSAAAAAMLSAKKNEAVQIIGIRPVLFRAFEWIKAPTLLTQLAPAVTQTALSDTKAQTDARVAALDIFGRLPDSALGPAQIEALLELARKASDTDLRFAAIRAVNALPDSIKPVGIDDLTLTRLKVTAIAGMKYDKESLTVTAGRPVELAFVNPDTMEHNLVVTLPGRAAEIGAAMSADPTAAAAVGYVPEDSSAVLFFTRMLKPGESQTLRFIAPKNPGSYDYVCTYPGHYGSMKGILQVVAP
ncbi:MAG: plastocyanin/azurin family copper-binding protein [Phycisphaeraceae bacterium]